MCRPTAYSCRYALYHSVGCSGRAAGRVSRAVTRHGTRDRVRERVSTRQSRSRLTDRSTLPREVRGLSERNNEHRHRHAHRRLTSGEAGGSLLTLHVSDVYRPRAPLRSADPSSDQDPVRHHIHMTCHIHSCSCICAHIYVSCHGSPRHAATCGSLVWATYRSR